MEKIYTVKITSQAEEQMQEIIHYIAYELKAPDAAPFNNKKLREPGYPTFTEFYLKVCEN